MRRARACVVHTSSRARRGRPAVSPLRPPARGQDSRRCAGGLRLRRRQAARQRLLPPLAVVARRLPAEPASGVAAVSGPPSAGRPAGRRRPAYRPRLHTWPLVPVFVEPSSISNVSFARGLRRPLRPASLPFLPDPSCALAISFKIAAGLRSPAQPIHQTALRRTGGVGPRGPSSAPAPRRKKAANSTQQRVRRLVPLAASPHQGSPGAEPDFTQAGRCLPPRPPVLLAPLPSASCLRSLRLRARASTVGPPEPHLATSVARTAPPLAPLAAPRWGAPRRAIRRVPRPAGLPASWGVACGVQGPFPGKHEREPHFNDAAQPANPDLLTLPRFRYYNV